MNLMLLSNKLIYLVVFLLGTTVSVYAHPNIDRSTATNPEVVLEIEPTAYPLAKALGASSHIHPTEKVEGTAAGSSSKSGKTILPPPFAGGKGTPNNPYQIATAGQLNEIRNYLDKHFILIADINLDVAPYNTGKGWKPIENKKTRFTGNVNGNGHTIDGLFINKSTTNYVGLFGYTQGATINSVGLTTVNVKGKNFTGGLVGYTNKSSITNSSATGKVKGKSRVGGLVGYTSKSSITSSYATGKVTGDGLIGGLVGYNTKSSSISDSYATGSVTGKKFVGGLAGWNTKSSITSSYATGSVTGNNNAGGFIGYYSFGSLTHNYWDTQSSGKTKGIGNKGKQSGVTGKTSMQMTKQATFKGWDFSMVWAITKNTTYPWLKNNAQNPPPAPVPSNPFAGGDGSPNNPYQIATAGQLNEVRNYLDKSFILIADQSCPK